MALCMQAGVPAAPSGDAAGKLPTGQEPFSADVEYLPAAQLQPLNGPAAQCQVRRTQQRLAHMQFIGCLGASSSER